MTWPADDQHFIVFLIPEYILIHSHVIQTIPNNGWMTLNSTRKGVLPISYSWLCTVAWQEMLKFKMFNWHQLNMVSYHGISANDLWISLVVQSFHHQNQPDFPAASSCQEGWAVAPAMVQREYGGTVHRTMVPWRTWDSDGVKGGLFGGDFGFPWKKWGLGLM